MSHARLFLWLIICLLLTASFGRAADRAASPKRQKESDAKKKKADAIKKEVEKLRGEWEVVELNLGGEIAKNFGKENLGANIIVKEDMITIKFQDGSEWAGWKYRINPSAKTASLDFDMNERETFKAIYRMDGDTLKVCSAITHEQGKRGGVPADSRPTDFSVKRGPDTVTVLFTLKRMKK